MLKSKLPEIIERAIEKPSTPVEIIFSTFSLEFTELFPITLTSTLLEIDFKSSQSASNTPFFIASTCR